MLSLAYFFIAHVFSLSDTTFSDEIKIGENYYEIGLAQNNLLYVLRSTYDIINGSYHNLTDETYMVEIDFIATILQGILDDLDNRMGGVLYIKEGTYILNRNIIVGNNIHINGAGISKTILKLKDNADPFIYGSYKKSGFIRARYCNDLIISNLTLDGNKKNQLTDDNHAYGRFGIFTESCNFVWLDRVNISNFQGYGFDPHGKKPDDWGEFLTITNCVSENNDWDGFTIDQTVNAVISNCEANGNGRHGFNIVTGTKYASISNSVSRNNGFYDPKGGSGCGFMMQNNEYYDTHSIFVNGNEAINNKKAGVCLNDVENVYVRNNYIKGNLCFEIINSTSSAFINNKCETDRFLKENLTEIIYRSESSYDDDINVVYIDQKNGGSRTSIRYSCLLSIIAIMFMY